MFIGPGQRQLSLLVTVAGGCWIKPLPAKAGRFPAGLKVNFFEPQNIEQGIMNVEGKKSSFEIPCSIFDIQNANMLKLFAWKEKVLNLVNRKINCTLLV